MNRKEKASVLLLVAAAGLLAAAIAAAGRHGGGPGGFVIHAAAPAAFGLRAGAPVKVHGVEVGEVTAVALDRDPARPGAPVRVAMRATARARFEEALALDRAREVPAAVAADLAALARVAERSGDRSAAATYLARSARIARRLGDLDGAERALRRALALAPPEAAGPIADELEALLAAREPTDRGEAPPLATPLVRRDGAAGPPP